MKEFYYQIKGKCGSEQSGSGPFGHTNWVFPPIFSGKVEAENKKEAQKIINEEYDKKFPLRVLNKDLDSNDFLLNIDEINPNNNRYKNLFELKICPQCGETYRVIDKYNDFNETYKGQDYCSQKCKDIEYNTLRVNALENEFINRTNNPVIYKITNKNNNKCYIGKTNQVFTLRWYQHFYQHTNCKFHTEIKNTKLTDWLFEIIEIVDIEFKLIMSAKDVDKIVKERETYWINFYDSINDGYNSIK